jgi:ATP-dependent helicase/DNAse subunit B
MSKALYCGDFPQLQTRFINDVSALRKQDPLAPLTVLVTGQLVRLALRRSLAQAGCSHANIVFLTLNEFAHRLVQEDLESHHLKTLHDVLLDPLMQQALAVSRSQLRYFAKLVPHHGFRLAIWSTINDLRCAGITAEHLSQASENIELRLGGILRQKLRELAHIWTALQKAMTQHKQVDRLEILRLATDKVAGLNVTQALIFYGIDELTELEAQFLERLTAKGVVLAYLPFSDGEAYRWTEPVYQWYLTQGFAVEDLDFPADADSHALARIQTVFVEDAASNQEFLTADKADTSLLLLSAPGEARETEEIVREVLNSPLAKDGLNRTVAVLLPANDPYVSLLREAFTHAGVQAYFHECRKLADSLSGRAFAYLVRLFDQQYRRQTIMGFLLSFPLQRPNWFPEDLTSVPVAEWNYFSQMAGIVAGKEAWNNGLDRLQNTLLAQQNSEQENDEAASMARARQLASLELFREFLSKLFSRIKSIAVAPSWRFLAEGSWTLLAELVQLDDERDTLEQEWKSIAALDELQSPVSLAQLRTIVQTILNTPAAREGRFQHQEPTVATLRQAKGVLFDEVMIPGLVEKRLPQSIAQDSLLLDDERRLLSQALGERNISFDIPLRRDLKKQEPYLFHVALSSARKRIVLSYPRLDSTLTRESLPSSFLIKALESLTGQPCDYETLDQYFRTGTQAKRIPLNRLTAMASCAPMTALDFDLVQLHKALREQDSTPLAYLLNRKLFRRAVQSESARFDREEFTRFDGVVEDGALRQAIAEQSGSQQRSLAPTRMETYASCPFLYFGKYVLGLEALDEPGAIQLVDRLERGTLIHRILEVFYRQEKMTGRLPLKNDAWPRLESIARQALAEFEREQITGLFMLWQLERESLIRQLHIFFQKELEDDSGFVPSEFEVRYRFALRLSDGSSLPLSARIDRIDRKGDQLARVQDYKTGKKQDYMKQGSLCGGRALQLPVYRLAVESKSDCNVESARYYYCTEKGEWQFLSFTKEDWQKNQAQFVDVVATIRSGIGEGRYHPYPREEHCRNCEVKEACGQGRFTNKWEHDLEQTADFRRMAGGND